MLKGKRDPPANISPDGCINAIAKKGCLREGSKILVGLDNCCEIPKTYHCLIDCDNASLKELIAILSQEEYAKLGSWYILNTSLNHFSLLNFGYYTWKRYFETLSHFPLVHKEYVFCTEQKGYAVLRTGAKNGIVPTLMYKIPSQFHPRECGYCLRVFQKYLDLWRL